ncbi:MAG: metal ABC transporter ATP-binding protein [Phycisphaeraceae bacterium]
MPLPDRVSPPTAAGPTVLRARGLTVAYRREPVLQDIDLDLPGGQLIAVVGPNGAGKSTLVKACLDLAPTSRGEVRLLDEKYRKVRRRIGYMPQRESVDWDFPVSALDVVAMGLYGRIGWCKPVTRKYKRLAREAMDHVGIADLADRQISQLSGGQQQRVFLARALAQDAELYFMDEPFAAVDAATESAIVDVLRELQRTGKTCIVVHHDLATVPRYFDHVVLLNRTLVAAGPTAETFTADNLQRTYGGKLVTFPDAPRTAALQVA